MSTIIRTNLKDNSIIKVKESLTTIHKLLKTKEKYIVISEIRFNKPSSKIIIDTATIKLVKKSMI